MKSIAILIVAALTLLAGARGAFAEDDEPAALLRRARHVETVDRNLDAAAVLYRRAMEGGGASDVARDAGLALARLLEEREKGSEALTVLRYLTERLGTRLDETAKRGVHEAMLRLLPPGSRARSPLGEVYVVPAGGSLAATSPLERKLDRLLSAFDQEMNAQSRYNLSRKLRTSLESVAPDALPILERNMWNAAPQRSAAAAGLYAYFGQSRAVPGLFRAIREGDGFTRDAALGALWQIEPPSAALVAGADEVLATMDPSPARARLARAIAKHLAPVEFMRRHDAGGNDADFWLEMAVEARAPGAIERTLEQLEKDPDLGEHELSSFFVRVIRVPARGIEPYMRSLPLGTVLRIVRLATSRPAMLDDAILKALVNTVRALTEREEPAAAETAAAAVWGLLTSLPGETRQHVLVKHLCSEVGHWPRPAKIAPPGALFEGAAWTARFIRLVPGHDRRVPYKELRADERFWKAVLARAGVLESEKEADWLRILVGHVVQNGLPPSDHDPAWLALLDREPWRSSPGGIVIHAAARSGDPAFLEHARRLTIGSDWKHRYASTSFSAFRHDYEGPGKAEFLRDALASIEATLLVTRSASHCDGFCRTLYETGGEAGRDALGRVARDWSKPAAVAALRWLEMLKEWDRIDTIFEAAAEAEALPPSPYQSRLIDIARVRHLETAAPYLLRAFREGDEKKATEAIEAIRAYHERLAGFAAWAKGERVAGARTLVDLLGDEDAEVRRAAALALGALGVMEALPALVKAAKEDADPLVRQAALQAVERISK